jgi:hypothetical protein
MIEIEWGMLLCLAGFAVAIYLGKLQVERGNFGKMRPISAFELLRCLADQAIETGRCLHISLGTGGISGQSTADSLAGLEVLESLSKQSAAAGMAPVTTMSDPTLLPLAEDVACRAAPTMGPRPSGQDIRWLAPQPSAYAAGVMGIIGSESIQANAMVGVFGDEYLLLGSAANRHHSTLVGAATDPTVLPFVVATADKALLGEEMFAAGAYLSDKPWHLASLLAQDWMRWIIVAIILALVIVGTIV